MDGQLQVEQRLTTSGMAVSLPQVERMMFVYVDQKKSLSLSIYIYIYTHKIVRTYSVAVSRYRVLYIKMVQDFSPSTVVQNVRIRDSIMSHQVRTTFGGGIIVYWFYKCLRNGWYLYSLQF